MLDIDLQTKISSIFWRDHAVMCSNKYYTLANRTNFRKEQFASVDDINQIYIIGSLNRYFIFILKCFSALADWEIIIWLNEKYAIEKIHAINPKICSCRFENEFSGSPLYWLYFIHFIHDFSCDHFGLTWFNREKYFNDLFLHLY